MQCIFQNPLYLHSVPGHLLVPKVLDSQERCLQAWEHGRYEQPSRDEASQQWRNQIHRKESASLGIL